MLKTIKSHGITIIYYKYLFILDVGIAYTSMMQLDVNYINYEFNNFIS